jgi:co-chaperonin GroES (HSP10)
MNKITPFGKNILVKPIEKKQILVTDEGNLCEYGEVIAVGDKVEEVKVGDVIGYTIWGVNRLVIDDEKYYFIPETDDFLLGKITL